MCVEQSIAAHPSPGCGATSVYEPSLNILHDFYACHMYVRYHYIRHTLGISTCPAFTAM